MRTRINRASMALFVFVALMPATAWAGTGDVVGVGFWLFGYLEIAFGYMIPAEPWMWPFSIGILWLLALNKAVRKEAHWVVYATFWQLFGGLWLLSKIPLLGKAIGFVRGLYSKIVGHSIESLGLTVRECTIGIFGCMILAGILGGNRATSNEYWLYLGFLPIGVAGLGAMTGFIIEKIGGKDAKAKLKEASKGSLLSLWARFRHGVPEEVIIDGVPPPTDPSDDDPRKQEGVNCNDCGTLNPVGYVVCGECESQAQAAPQEAVAVPHLRPVSEGEPVSVPRSVAEALDLADDDV